MNSKSQIPTPDPQFLSSRFDIFFASFVSFVNFVVKEAPRFVFRDIDICGLF